MPHHTHTDTSSALALSGPARSAVQEELLAHVSGGLVNRVVISPLLFRLSPAFSSKSHGLPGGAGVTVFDWSERWESVSYWDTRPLKVTVTPPTPNVHPHCSPLTAHRSPLTHTPKENHPGGQNTSAAQYSMKCETGSTSDCQAAFFSFQIENISEVK